MRWLIFLLLAGCSIETSNSPVIHPQHTDCLSSGGVWSLFSDGCVDICGVSSCFSTSVYSCDCGIDSCWDGEICQSEIIEVIHEDPDSPHVVSSSRKCLQAGGEWIVFSDTCAGLCYNEYVSCFGNPTSSCDCGPYFCWDGESCVSGESFDAELPSPERCELGGGDWGPLSCDDNCADKNDYSCIEDGFICDCGDRLCWNGTGCSPGFSSLDFDKLSHGPPFTIGG